MKEKEGGQQLNHFFLPTYFAKYCVPFLLTKSCVPFLPNLFVHSLKEESPAAFFHR